MLSGAAAIAVPARNPNPVASVAQQQKTAEIREIQFNGMFHAMVHCVAKRLHGVA
jgi:hypothetical protein